MANFYVPYTLYESRKMYDLLESLSLTTNTFEVFDTHYYWSQDGKGSIKPVVVVKYDHGKITECWRSYLSELTKSRYTEITTEDLINMYFGEFNENRSD